MEMEWQAHPGETLRQHLLRVADRIALFLRLLPQAAIDDGVAAALMHDLGKACDEFLRGRLWQALPEDQRSLLDRMFLEYVLDHSRPGAVTSFFHAKKNLDLESLVRASAGRIVAIDGHHAAFSLCNNADKCPVNKKLQFMTDMLSSSDLKGGKPRETVRGGKLSIGKSLAERNKGSTEPMAVELMKWLDENGIKVPSPRKDAFFDPCCSNGEAVAQMINARLLLGALVDADCMETRRQHEEYVELVLEAFESGMPHDQLERKFGLKTGTASKVIQEGLERGRVGTTPRKPSLDDHPRLEPRRALDALLRHVRGVRERAKAAGVDPKIMEARDALLEFGLRAGGNSTIGNYSMTAPTGLGKTIAMVAFALAMAEKHGLERIIISVPYLSILYQSADELKEVFEKEFGVGYVVENHSLAFDREEADLAESKSWNAPIIITTNVQLLESMFSANGGKLRKLHRMVNAVILFDEVQSFPYGLLVPTLAALSHLVDGYGRTTILTATATNPHFELLSGKASIRGKEFRGYLRDLGGKWEPKEVVPKAAFDGLQRRFKTLWRGEISQESLVSELASRKQVMCVVNIKEQAAETYLKLLLSSPKEETFYLSTNLPPMARTAILDEVRERLKSGLPVRLVTTQSVEAGVDIDFPSVFRALAPLVALIQAAGRCNRGGILAEGEFVVFIPAWVEDERRYPDDDYKTGANIAERLLGPVGSNPDILDHSMIREYFSEMYVKRETVDDPKHKAVVFGDNQSGGILVKDEGDRVSPFMDFKGVARNYRVIDKANINILVPHPGGAFAALRDEVIRKGVTEEWEIRARQTTVCRSRPNGLSPLFSAIRPLQYRDEDGELQDSKEWFVYENRYDPSLGVNESGRKA